MIVLNSNSGLSGLECRGLHAGESGSDLLGIYACV